MDTQLKYIIVLSNGHEIPIIFCTLIEHRAAVPRGFCKPVSAGFLTLSDCKVICYGESVSLNLKARVEDATIVQKHLDAAGLTNRQYGL